MYEMASPGPATAESRRRWRMPDAACPCATGGGHGAREASKPQRSIEAAPRVIQRWQQPGTLCCLASVSSPHSKQEKIKKAHGWSSERSSTPSFTKSSRSVELWNSSALSVLTATCRQGGITSSTLQKHETNAANPPAQRCADGVNPAGQFVAVRRVRTRANKDIWPGVGRGRLASW